MLRRCLALPLLYTAHPTPHTYTPPSLQQLDITFRRDPANYRPRINKRNSQNDQEQKKMGTFYYADD